MCGLLFGFLVWLSQKFTFKGEVDVRDNNMRLARRMQFVELTNTSVSVKHGDGEDKLDDDEI